MIGVDPACTVTRTCFNFGGRLGSGTALDGWHDRLVACGGGELLEILLQSGTQSVVNGFPAPGEAALDGIGWDGWSAFASRSAGLEVDQISVNDPSRADSPILLDVIDRYQRASGGSPFVLGMAVAPRDTDGDGAYDADDNCPVIATPNQERLADARCNVDTDRDNVHDGADN